MKKEEFLKELRDKLTGLPKEDIDDRISFYSEAIDDRIDDGKSEEEAVNEIGTVDEIVNEIAEDTPLFKLVKERVKPKRSLKVWEIVLIVIGFPVWLPLLITASVLLFVAYLLLWVLVIVTYTVELGLSVAALGGLVIFFIQLFSGNFNAIALGSSILAAGGSILLYFGCVAVTKVNIKISKNIINGIKKSFFKKGK